MEKRGGEGSTRKELSLPYRVENILDSILMSCLMVNFDCQTHGVSY